MIRSDCMEEKDVTGPNLRNIWHHLGKKTKVSQAGGVVGIAVLGWLVSYLS